MPFGYPVFLELGGRRALVVGAGAVAQGKVEGLLAAGATVTVVAPGPRAALDRLEHEPRVTVERRPFGPDDLDGVHICVAWSDDADLRATIAHEARRRRVLVNVMDDVPNCDFAAPAVVRRGDLVLAISTGGRSPALARRLREVLSERFGPEWAELLAILGEARQETLGALTDVEDRARRWQDALDLDEAEELVREGRADELRSRLVGRLLAGERA